MSEIALPPKTWVRHLISSLGVFGALSSAIFCHPVVVGTISNHKTSIYLINVFWSLYYGIGFEPEFVWYRAHGPFSSGFLDLLGGFIYPIVASVLLYIALFKISARPSHRKWVIASLGVSFLLLFQMPFQPLGTWWMHPFWSFGAMILPP